MPMKTSVDGRILGVTDTNRLGALGSPYSITGTAATDGTNATLVTLTVKDYEGNTCAGVWFLNVWLSDAVDGGGITATTASGAVGDKTAGTTGTVMGTMTAKKALQVITKNDGTYQLSITDTAKTAFKVCGSFDGRTNVAITLATANYG